LKLNFVDSFYCNSVVQSRVTEANGLDLQTTEELIFVC